MHKKADTTNLLNFRFREYEKLKEEQIKRIEFRDHMIYLTLGVSGTVFSIALEKPALGIAYLVLPFVCTILGWTYLVNDEKISSIASYIRSCLIPHFKNLDSDSDEIFDLSWETFLRKDRYRNQRKWTQLVVDLSTFCLTSTVSIVAFYEYYESVRWFHILISAIEIAFLVFLSLQFIRYAELSRPGSDVVLNGAESDPNEEN